MIKYKTTVSNKKPEELELLNSRRDTYNTWRVYFDIIENLEKRKTYTTTIYKTEVVTEKSLDPLTGEEIVTITEQKIPVEITEEIREYNSKYVEIKKPKSEKPTALGIVKELMKKEIDDYDKSSEVNSFSLNDLEVWLDKDTRVGLMNSTMIQKNAGLSETTLWLGTIPLHINCNLAIKLLGGLEIYALDCFNKTAEHKRNVENLTTVKEVAEYNYTIGYPDKLILKTE